MRRQIHLSLSDIEAHVKFNIEILLAELLVISTGRFRRQMEKRGWTYNLIASQKFQPHIYYIHDDMYIVHSMFSTMYNNTYVHIIGIGLR